MFNNKIINTQEEAYILGIFYADGYMAKSSGPNNKYYNFSLSLSEKDSDIIEKLYNILSKENIKRIEIKKSFAKYKDKSFPICELKIIDFIFNEKLVNFGIVHRKTYENSSKVFDSIPENLKSHFIRGYFDGDGSIYKPKSSEKRTVKFISLNFKLITKLNDWLVKNLDLNIKTKNKVKLQDNKYPKFSYSGNANCKKILDELYKNSTIHLDRKYKLYLEIPKLFEKKSKYKGVCWNNQKNKWMVRIYTSKKIPPKYFGLYNTEEDAYNKIKELNL